MTQEELAPYGVGAMDEDGWFEDYNLPPELKPQALETPEVEGEGSKPRRMLTLDVTYHALVENWRLVVLDLQRIYRINLHDPAVRAGSLLAVRPFIQSLYETPGSLLRDAVVKEEGQDHAAESR